MSRVPLIKVRWSNEHIMAALFAVLILYQLPLWAAKPILIVNFVIVVVFGLLIDGIASRIRHQRIWCCVSGAVTAAIISVLSSKVPLWGQLLGVAFALIVGKHLQGGTGRNVTNPAIIAFVVLLPSFGYPAFLFEPSVLLLPGLVLGLVFLFSRPYAGVAFMIGMLGAMYVNQELTFHNIIAYGVLFWGCIIMTDPVTVTPQPLVGAIMGLLAGAVPFIVFKTPIAVVLGVLVINLFSEDIAAQIERLQKKRNAVLKIPKIFSNKVNDMEIIDLTEDKDTLKASSSEAGELSKEIILNRIKKHNVFGMGGAAFSTYQKLMTVMESEVADKYLLINGAECDPGLIHDAWLMRKQWKEIMQGMELLRTCIPFKQCYLAVKDKSGLTDTDQLPIKLLKDSYPIGAEKILIQEVLGKSLTKDQIPAKSGILVLNVQTVYTLGVAVWKDKPVNSRYLTVANLRRKQKLAKVVKVPLGMRLQEIMEAVYPGTVNIFAGGGIMQAFLTEEDAVVDKTTNFIAASNLPGYKESPQCSKCGTCSKNCPMGLQVKKIADLVDQGKSGEAVRYHAGDCISCGSCSYSCLAGNNLAAKVSMAKEAIIAMNS